MNPKTILVIEDNQLNMKLIKSLLGLGGYRVLEAMDAEAGIQLLGQHTPDLILMDIQLPGMDGLDASRQIKKDRKLKNIPIVALTSYAMKVDEQMATEAGCCGFIAKPIDTRNFLNTLAGFLTD